MNDRCPTSDQVLEPVPDASSAPGAGAGGAMPFLPAVTVVVPVYNGALTLGACLDSLLSLDYPPEKLEILVVDNASIDGTAQILKDYGPALRVTHEPKRGRPAACNRGIREAAWEIIAMTDADCVLDPRWLLSLVAPLQAEDVGLVGGKILSIHPDRPIELFGEQIHDNAAAIAQRFPSVIGMSWACRRSILNELHGFDEQFLRVQDSDLSFRIAEAGYRLVYAPGAILYHHNEETLWGLYQEGYKHGHWSVLWCRKHAAALRQVRRRRFSIASYQSLGRSVLTACCARQQSERVQARCSLCFNVGKKLGKLTGSARFRYLEL